MIIYFYAIKDRLDNQEYKRISEKIDEVMTKNFNPESSLEEGFRV